MNWTPEQIRAEIERRGTTITQLSADHGLRRNVLSTSLIHKNRLPKHHKIIADFLGRELHEIWPDLYRPGETEFRRGYKPRYGKAHFEAVLRRIERGESFYAITEEPGQPSTASVYAYMKRNRSFALRWAEVMRATGKGPVTEAEIERVLARVEAGESLKDACRHPGSPSVSSVGYWRAKNPRQEDRWLRAFRGHGAPRLEKTPWRQDQYIEAVKAGTHWRDLGNLIAWHAVSRLRTVDPSFATRLDEARQAGRAAISRAASARKLSPTEIYNLVESAVRHVPEYARDDVRGDLMLALLDGRVSADQAASAVRGLVTAWNRNFARRDISFDQELGEGEGLTFGGLIADPSSFVPGGVRVVRPKW